MERGLRLFVAATVVLLVTAGIAIAAVSMHFNSPMEGAQEAPVPRDTQARGNAVYKLSADGTHIEYKVIVANIENVFMAHIHMGPPGVSGPIVVWLCGTPAQAGPAGTATCPGRAGVVRGSFAAANVLSAGTQQLAAGELSELILAMRAGVAYVNVHSTLSPGGEIRGQVSKGNYVPR